MMLFALIIGSLLFLWPLLVVVDWFFKRANDRMEREALQHLGDIQKRWERSMERLNERRAVRGLPPIEYERLDQYKSPTTKH